MVMQSRSALALRAVLGDKFVCAVCIAAIRLRTAAGFARFPSAFLVMEGMRTMSAIVDVIKLLIVCGTLLGLAFTALLAMPKSQLRSILLQLVGWATVVFCILWGLSPADILPEALLGPVGLIDDVVAVAMAIGAGRVALQAGRDLKDFAEQREE